MALLSVNDLVVNFRTRDQVVHAVNGISFELAEGETLGLVGESGCGKSVTSLAIMRLLPRPTGRIERGTITFNSRNLLELSNRDIRSLRGREIAMVFQDPMTSLNPVLTIGTQLQETITAHRSVNQASARATSIKLLDAVGIADSTRSLRRYPHEFSGGMRQRVMLAMALALAPRLLIADEPTTALDVTVQAQVLELIRQLTREFGTAVILITHDMGVVAAMADRVAVMYAGNIVEIGPTREVFEGPQHPYTVGLLHSIPYIGDKWARLVPIEGSPPDLTADIPGCPFAPRCAWRVAECLTVKPELLIPTRRASDTSAGARLLACHAPPTAAEAVLGRPASYPSGGPA